jgi:hypothetical protein
MKSVWHEVNFILAMVAYMVRRWWEGERQWRPERFRWLCLNLCLCFTIGLPQSPCVHCLLVIFHPKKKIVWEPRWCVTYHKDLGIFIPLSFAIHSHIGYFSRNLPSHNLDLIHSSIWNDGKKKKKKWHNPWSLCKRIANVLATMCWANSLELPTPWNMK